MQNNKYASTSSWLKHVLAIITYIVIISYAKDQAKSFKCNRL